MSDFQVVAKLIANVSDFKSGISQAVSSLRELERQTGSKMGQIGKATANAGKALTAGVTAPIAALGGYLLRLLAIMKQH